MMVCITLGFGILFLALVGDLYERHLRYLKEIEKELMTTKEVDDMEKDYVYLNDGTPVEYNEDDQE